MKSSYVLVLLFILSVVIKLFLYLSTELLPYVDGGYYIYTVRDLMNGELTDVTTPLVFYYLAAFFSFIPDEILAIKVGISILSSLVVFPAYLITNYLTKDDKLSLFSAFLFTFSFPSVRLMGDLYKNVGGVVFALSFLYFLIRIFNEKPKAQHLFFSFLFFMLLLFSHLTTSAYVFSLTIPLSLALIYDVLTKENIRDVIYRGILILFVLISSLFVFFFLVGGVADDVPYVNEEFSLGRINPSIFSNYNILLLPAVWGVYSLFRQNKKLFLLFFTGVLLSLILTQPSVIIKEWTFRFMLISHIPIFLLVAIGIKNIKKYQRLLIIFLSIYAFLFFVLEFTEYDATITAEEYEGLKLLKSVLPADADFVVSQNIGKHLEYWLMAAGLEVTEEISENTYLIGMGSTPERGRLISRVGRFYVIEPNRRNQ